MARGNIASTRCSNLPELEASSTPDQSVKKNRLSRIFKPSGDKTKATPTNDPITGTDSQNAKGKATDTGGQTGGSTGENGADAGDGDSWTGRSKSSRGLWDKVKKIFDKKTPGSVTSSTTTVT